MQTLLNIFSVSHPGTVGQGRFEIFNQLIEKSVTIAVATL